MAAQQPNLISVNILASQLIWLSHCNLVWSNLIYLISSILMATQQPNLIWSNLLESHLLSWRHSNLIWSDLMYLHLNYSNCHTTTYCDLIQYTRISSTKLQPNLTLFAPTGPVWDSVGGTLTCGHISGPMGANCRWRQLWCASGCSVLQCVEMQTSHYTQARSCPTQTRS